MRYVRLQPIPVVQQHTDAHGFTPTFTHTLAQTPTPANALQHVDVAILERCMHLAHHGYDLYLHATPTIRRQLNQAMFEKFYIDDDGILRAEPAGPFAVLLDPELLHASDKDKDKERAAETIALTDVPSDGAITKEVVSQHASGRLTTPCHHNHDWIDGTPRWLHELWVKAGKPEGGLHGQIQPTKEPSATCRALGLKEVSLVR